MKYLFRSYILLLLFLLPTIQGFSQIQRGGKPLSYYEHGFKLKSALAIFDVVAPNKAILQAQDNESNKWNKAYRVGIDIPAFFTTENAGEWTTLENGNRVWRLHLRSKEAIGIGLIFSKVKLPQEASFYVYTANYSNLIGAFTQEEVNGGGIFATQPLPGDECVIEYNAPASVKETPDIEISAITYLYRGATIANNKINYTRSAAAECEVNVNCVEGMAWKKQKQGVVKLLTSVGGDKYYCSGSLVSNTKQDFTPYILSAYHCSLGVNDITSTDDDYKKWVFYFNYEYPGCENIGNTESHTMVGATRIAIPDPNSPIKSDFLLVKLLSNVPLLYKPYYNGWDISEISSPSGVGIHHPEGDVKKISTYIKPLQITSYESSYPTHWSVSWAKTENGHGITEPGSSGSPLFNDKGLIVGTLTGGRSYCSTPEDPDSYGRMSYHWDKNGNTPEYQLKSWLDPLSTGKTSFVGSTFNNSVIANFIPNKTIIYPDATIDFKDVSAGKIKSWQWTFEGGSPSSSSQQNPAGISFNHTGKFKILLRVEGENSFDTISTYVYVRQLAYPNPTLDGNINIVVNADSNQDNNHDVYIDIFDMQGRLINQYKFSKPLKNVYTIAMPKSSNMYILQIKQGQTVQTQKVIVVN